MSPFINDFSILVTTCGATLTSISIAPPKNQLCRWMSDFRSDQLLQNSSYPNLTHFTFTYGVSDEEYVPFVNNNNNDGDGDGDGDRKDLMRSEINNQQIMLSLTDLTFAIVTAFGSTAIFSTDA